MEAALSSADPPRVLEQVTTVDTSQVAETRESPPCVRASTWHPPIAYQEVARANGSRAGLTRVPETDRSPEAASESGSAGVNRNASSKVAPMLTSSNVPARNQILVQVRNTKHIPQARIAPQNQPPPPPPPPPLQQGRPAAGTQQAATGALVRVEIREPPPLQRAPNRPAMPQQQLQELQPNRSALSQQQLQELQCQLAAYTYVTSMLNTRVRSEDQQQANPTDGPQPLPLNLAKQQPENAASLKCMPPLQYMPPGARPQARPSEVNNQQALLQLQSSQGSPRMPQLLPPSSANQPSVSAEERSQRPPANRVVAIQPMQALAPAQTSVELELQRRQYIELLLRYNFGRSLGDRQEAHRALQAFLATRNESMRASAPANQALPGAMDSGYQHQQRPGSTVEKSSSHQSLMRVTIPSGNAPSSGVERQGHTAADATRHAGSSLPQRRPQPVRPWCDESPQQPQRSRWPPPYASCQEAVLRYKQQQQQQQRGAEAVSRSAMPSVAESNSSLSERPSTSGQSSPMHGSSAQQNQEASSQPAVVRSSPEQGCAAMPSGSLQGRRGAPRAVVPNNHSAYQRFLDAFCGSSSVLLSQEGVVVLSTSNVSGPRSEAVAGQRRLPQAPHTAADARPPDTQLPR